MSNHLTNRQLRELLSSGDVKVERQLEHHLSGCESCRNRLHNLATNEEWRFEIRRELGRHFQDCSQERGSNQEALGVLKAGNAATDSASPHRIAAEKLLQEFLLPPSHPEMQGRLGQYDVERVIGVGGMGIVVRAWDRELQRPVAIKVISPLLLSDGTAKQRFVREARAAAAVLHPNVIAIHGIDETNGLPWFVMPLVNGPTLRESVSENGPLGQTEIARVGQQLASGLAAAHAHGVIHRDIKPANVLIDNFVNRIVITDFGLARRAVEHSVTVPGSVAGTLKYMSPEQIHGENLDGRSDLFSAGALLYFAATGESPFPGHSPAAIVHNVINERHVDVRILNAEIAAPVAETIDRLLSKSASDRFQSAADLEDHFTRLIAHLNHPTLHPAPVVRSQRMRRSKALLAASVTIALFVCMGLFLIELQGRIQNQQRGETSQVNTGPLASVEPAPEIDVTSRSDSFEAISSDMASLRVGFASIEGLTPIESRLEQDDRFISDLDIFKRNVQALQSRLADWQSTDPAFPSLSGDTDLPDRRFPKLQAAGAPNGMEELTVEFDRFETALEALEKEVSETSR